MKDHLYFQAIADEILKMAEEDQNMRKSGKWDVSVDRSNTARMKEIIAEMGWPTKSKFGERASHMAWLLVQHADHDLEFQKQCLQLIKEQPENEVKKSNIAYLEDRVRTNEGRPQLYGTQFYTDGIGNFGPRPIEDPDNLEQRRKAMEMEPFEQYKRRMFELYGKT